MIMYVDNKVITENKFSVTLIDSCFRFPAGSFRESFSSLPFQPLHNIPVPWWLLWEHPHSCCQPGPQGPPDSPGPVPCEPGFSWPHPWGRLSDRGVQPEAGLLWEGQPLHLHGPFPAGQHVEQRLLLNLDELRQVCHADWLHGSQHAACTPQLLPHLGVLVFTHRAPLCDRSSTAHWGAPLHYSITRVFKHSQRNQQQRPRRQNALRMISALVYVFFLCWLPENVFASVCKCSLRQDYPLIGQAGSLLQQLPDPAHQQFPWRELSGETDDFSPAEDQMDQN